MHQLVGQAQLLQALAREVGQPEVLGPVEIRPRLHLPDRGFTLQLLLPVYVI